MSHIAVEFTLSRETILRVFHALFKMESDPAARDTVRPLRMRIMPVPARIANGGRRLALYGRVETGFGEHMWVGDHEFYAVPSHYFGRLNLGTVLPLVLDVLFSSEKAPALSFSTIVTSGGVIYDLGEI
jgi:hypothetical protein